MTRQSSRGRLAFLQHVNAERQAQLWSLANAHMRTHPHPSNLLSNYHASFHVMRAPISSESTLQSDDLIWQVPRWDIRSFCLVYATFSLPLQIYLYQRTGEVGVETLADLLGCATSSTRSTSFALISAYFSGEVWNRRRLSREGRFAISVQASVNEGNAQ